MEEEQQHQDQIYKNERETGRHVAAHIRMPNDTVAKGQAKVLDLRYIVCSSVCKTPNPSQCFLK